MGLNFKVKSIKKYESFSTATPKDAKTIIRR